MEMLVNLSGSCAIMTEYNKVFLDTTPLIYFLDNDVNFGNKLNRFLKRYY